MPDDLVSGLLAAIEQREKVAQAAADAPPGSRHPGRGRRGLPGAAVLMPSRAWTEYDKLHGPESVLRLCRAHRNIIDMYQQAKARPVCREGREARLRGLDHASAMGRLTTLGLVLQALAEGYGVED